MLQDADGHVVTTVDAVATGAHLSVRVADGRVLVTASGTETDSPPPAQTQDRGTPDE